jgi:hypothetical protein
MKTLIYLLQVSACTGIFYALYFVLLRWYTFFTLNRWYLVGTLLLSFVIPAITIPVESVPQSALIQPVVFVQQMQAQPMHAVVLRQAAAEGIDWMNVLRVVYFTIAMASVLHLLFTFAVFLLHMRNKKLMQIGGVKVLRGDKKLGNSSFLNVVFINDDELEPEELKQVLAHELLHVKLLHSADRLIARLAQIILWFNPFAYCYIRSIEENHEFEVDRRAAGKEDKGVYAALLFKLAMSEQSYLFHGFSKVPLKKRIAMIFNKPTSNMKKIIYVLILPVAVIGCLAFANVKSTKLNAFTETGSLLSRHPTNTGVAMADTVARYRQKIKRTEKQQADYERGKKEAAEWRRSDDYKQKLASMNAVQGKALTYKVIAYEPQAKNVFSGSGYRVANNGKEYLLRAAYGNEKQLIGLFQPGDEIEVKVFNGVFGKDDLITLIPAVISKNGNKIYQTPEAGKIPDYPYLFEANRVRFTDGQITDVTRYANGKWKSAVILVGNGYKIRFNIKPTAPAFKGIAPGNQVRFRFVHEEKTGAKEYTVNDWVSLTTNIMDYGIKNPDFFYKFYEKAI